MKQLITCLLLCLLGGDAAKCQLNASKEPFITTSLSNETINKVHARTSGGGISVTRITSGESRVEIYVRPNNTKEILNKAEIQQRLEQHYQLTVDVTDGQLNMLAKQTDGKMNPKRQLSISFKVYVEPRVSTDLNTSGGSISLSNLTGTQDFSTSGGSLKISKLSGRTNGRTSGGSITVVDSRDVINLKTSGGSITAKNCAGNIKLATSGGSLNLADLNGNIDASTSGGSINANVITGEFNTHTSGGSVNLKSMSGSLEASTSGGSVNVDITKLGKYVRLANSGGHINLQMPDEQGIDLNLNASKINVDALNNFSGRKEDDEISGTLNGGGIPVTVRAGSGRINVKFK